MEKEENSTSLAQSAALLVIGNEILSGRTRDANTQYIGEKLALHGVPLREVRVVPDIEVEIIEALNALKKRYDFVFTTGGIGPTHDDITAECIAKAFDLPFERHERAYEILEEYYKDDEFTPARQRMTMMPKGAALIPNPVSGAPGFIVENVHVMAGVPRIMQAMFDHILTTIDKGVEILSSTITFKVPESQIAEIARKFQDDNPSVDIGSYPGYRDGKLWTSIVVRGTDKSLIEGLIKEIEEEVNSLKA